MIQEAGRSASVGIQFAQKQIKVSRFQNQLADASCE